VSTRRESSSLLVVGLTAFGLFMKRRHCSCPLLLAAAFGSALAFPILGQETKSSSGTNAVTLDTLVAEAWQNNPELRFYGAEIKAAKAGRKTAGVLANPEFNGSVGQKSVRGAGLSAEGVAWSVSVVQPFEWPGRIGLRKAIANRDVELAQLGLERFRVALTGRVRALGLLGHEVGQHTHFYNGTKIEKPKKTVDLSELNIVHCLRRDFETLAQMGSLPKGFTAGSWTVDERVLDILADLRFDYDCSAQFPKPNEMTQANSYSWLRSPYIHSNSRGHVLCLPTTCSLGEWFKWGRRVRTGGMIPYQLVYLHDYDLRSFRNRRLLSYFVKISGKGTLRPLTAIAQEYRRKEVDGVGPCE